MSLLASTPAAAADIAGTPKTSLLGPSCSPLNASATGSVDNDAMGKTYHNFREKDTDH